MRLQWGMLRPLVAVRAAAVLALVGLALACSADPAPVRAGGAATSAAAGAANPARRGRLAEATFRSAALGVDKRYRIYLPAGYDDDPARRWPVLYYLHGLGGDEDDWVDGGHLDQVADQVGLAAIVVMPDGDDSFYADAVSPAADYAACRREGAGLLSRRGGRAHQCVRQRAYERYLVDDLLGHVDATYRTLAARTGRAIAGLSMGGLGAWMLALRHPDRFAGAASHSGLLALLYQGPHPYQPGAASLATDVSRWGVALGELGAWVRGIFGPDHARWLAHDPASLIAQVQPGQLALYLDCGTEDLFRFDAHAAYVHDLLTARGVAHTFFLGPGRHDFRFWHDRLDDSLRFLADAVGAPLAPR